MLTVSFPVPSFSHLKAQSNKQFVGLQTKVSGEVIYQFVVAHGYESADGPEIIILHTSSSTGSSHIHTFSPLPNHSKTAC